MVDFSFRKKLPIETQSPNPSGIGGKGEEE
jgi:hypothetical protein